MFISISTAITAALGSPQFNIRNLFAANEPGLSYDTDDLTTMFLDAAGTTPATVNGLVGLVMDKSRGLALGSEVIPQPLDLTTWTTVGTLSATTANTFTNSSGAGAGKSRSVGVGKWFRVSVTYTKSDASTLFGLYDGGTTITLATSTAASGTLTAIYRATDLFYMRLGGNATVTITSISVKEIAGNHAYQSTTGFKPVLRGTPTGLNLFASYGTPGAGWANSGGGVATGTATTGSIPTNVVPAASRVYRVRYTATVTSGTVRLTLGGVNGATRSASGTYEEYIAATSTAALSFQGVTAFTGTVSAIDMRDVSADSVTAPYGLQFDGADDFLQTASVDFSATDKMTVCAGVRKLSDAAAGLLLELGVIGSGANGGFSVTAPPNNGLARYGFGTRGTASQAFLGSSSPYSYPAVISNVLACSFNNAGLASSNAISPRVNGAAMPSTDDGLTGTSAGGYANAPLYIGRRGGTALPFNGLLYSPTILGRTATSAELANLERYTARRTGVTI